MEGITETMRTKAWYYHFTEALYQNGTISDERRTDLKKKISMLNIPDEKKNDERLQKTVM